MRLERFQRPVRAGHHVNPSIAVDQNRQIRGREFRTLCLLCGVEDLGGVFFEQAHTGLIEPLSQSLREFAYLATEDGERT